MKAGRRYDALTEQPEAVPVGTHPPTSTQTGTMDSAALYR